MNGEKWLTVAQAAARLGVSKRAVQKRAARGTLAARRIERDGATLWEIDPANMDAPANPRPRTNGREPANLSGEVGAPIETFHAQERREPPANMDAPANREPRTDGRAHEMSAEREADYRTEISFLRGLIEQRDRDAAELRAALRKALEAQPRALMAASEPAPTPQESPRTGESDGAAPITPEAPKDAQDGREMTYADVLAQLEESL